MFVSHVSFPKLEGDMAAEKFIPWCCIFWFQVVVSLLPVMGVNKYEIGQFGCDFQWADRSTLGAGYVYFRGIVGKKICIIIYFQTLNVV